jgi:hypothetical protein
MKTELLAFSLSFLLLQYGCNFEKKIQPPYRFTYEQISGLKLQDPDILSCIDYYKPRKFRFIYGKIENNLYNSISLPLVSLKCGNQYALFPDVIQSIGMDSTILAVSSIFNQSADTIVQLGKGANLTFLLPITLPFSDHERLKNYFSVTVDSA